MSVDKVSEIEKLEVFAQDLLARIHTFAPGIVDSYDDARQTATILPGRRGADLDGRPFDLPPIPGVLVMWPTFGGMRMQGTLVKDDEVLLGIPGRSFDKWILAGGVADQDDAGQAFSLSQALAFPALTSATKRPGPAGSFLRIGRVDGSAEVRIRMDKQGTALVEIEGAEIKLGATATQSVTLAGLLEVFLGAAAAAAATAAVPADGGAVAFTTFANTITGVIPPGLDTASGAAKAKAE